MQKIWVKIFKLFKKDEILVGGGRFSGYSFGIRDLCLILKECTSMFTEYPDTHFKPNFVKIGCRLIELCPRKGCKKRKIGENYGTRVG
jgi:hypothetical protein